jgi:hypothetical protein
VEWEGYLYNTIPSMMGVHFGGVHGFDMGFTWCQMDASGGAIEEGKFTAPVCH